jgi:hypothetical protein
MTGAFTELAQQIAQIAKERHVAQSTMRECIRLIDEHVASDDGDADLLLAEIKIRLRDGLEGRG